MTNKDLLYGTENDTQYCIIISKGKNLGKKNHCAVHLKLTQHNQRYNFFKKILKRMIPFCPLWIQFTGSMSASTCVWLRKFNISEDKSPGWLFHLSSTGSDHSRKLLVKDTCNLTLDSKTANYFVAKVWRKQMKEEGIAGVLRLSRWSSG